MRIIGYQYTMQWGAPEHGWGESEHKDQAITISPDLSPEQTISTVLHEIIEALNFVALGLELPHSHICMLEAGLYQVLTDAGVDLAPLLIEMGKRP